MYCLFSTVYSFKISQMLTMLCWLCKQYDWFTGLSHILPIQASALSQPGFLKPSKRNKEDSVRVRTLNIIIYKAVVDLLSSFEVNSEISAYNVQISKVGYALPSKFLTIINHYSIIKRIVYPKMNILPSLMPFQTCMTLFSSVEYKRKIYFLHLH